MPSLTQTAETFARTYGEKSPEQAIRKGKATMSDWLNTLNQARSSAGYKAKRRNPSKTSEQAEADYQAAITLLSNGRYISRDVEKLLNLSPSTISTYIRRALNERKLERKPGPKPHTYRHPK